MKALSIKQPWATAIAIGVKPVENRSKRTHYRGRIALHTSVKRMPGSPRDIIGHKRWDILTDFQKEAIWEGIKINGAIIGETTIIDCVESHSSIWADAGHYQWVLGDVVMYDEPIFGIKGALGLWEWEKPYEMVGSAELVKTEGLI